jgi:hypothetical protein
VLSEEGCPQAIGDFSRESEFPLMLGLLVDQRHQRHVVDQERGACMRFVDQVVREQRDQVFLM